MTRTLIVLATAATLITGSVLAPSSADARNRGGAVAAGVFGALAAGAIFGSAATGYGYYPYGYAYAYPPDYYGAYAYEPGYAYVPAPRYYRYYSYGHCPVEGAGYRLDYGLC